MSSCKINEECVDLFVASYPIIYQNFMDFGGKVFNDSEIIARVKKLFYACAISNNINWDFLCQTAIPRLYDITRGFTYADVCAMDINTFENVFLEYPKKHKVEATNRLEMLRKLSDYTSNKNNQIFTQILNAGTLSGDQGLTNVINTIPVFEDDSLHKKGNLLVQILLREGLVNVADEYNVEPSIDYHVIRFFLRYGFFKLDKETIQRLSSGAVFSLEETTELRKTISECMKHLSKKGVSIAKMGFIAWTIGRTYCRSDYTACTHNENCPVSCECYGCKNPLYRDMKEPESNVGFY